MAPTKISRGVQWVSAVGENEADNDQQREQQEAHPICGVCQLFIWIRVETYEDGTVVRVGVQTPIRTGGGDTAPITS